MRHRWTADAAQTGGMLACVEVTVPPGAGIAPHRHRHEDQACYVVRGAVVFEGDDLGFEARQRDTRPDAHRMARLGERYGIQPADESRG